LVSIALIAVDVIILASASCHDQFQKYWLVIVMCG